MIQKGLNFFSGNKLENLVKALAKVIEMPLKNVFSGETIIVQSHGMARWLSLNLAASHGIAANISYRFPNDFVYDIPEGLSSYKKEISLYDPGVMTWKIMQDSIADRSIRNESRIADTFMNLLALSESRFGLSDLIDILENQAVQERFGIVEKELEKIVLWVRDTKIRWGIDGEHRGRLGMPEFEENSWMAGLKRMLLGYAMPGEGETLYKNILPYNLIEGEDAVLLGRFCEFVERVFKFAGRLSKDRSVKDWVFLLLESLDCFFSQDDGNGNELQMIRDELNSLDAVTGLVEYQATVGFSVIRYYLAKKLDSREHGHGFITGGITFCAMLPMRSIPFKVICFLGMNSDTYPRQTRSPGFDLIAKKPRRGDRSKRKDDRYLFLEVLISARNKLYISYTGQSIKDNSAVQPSVLVSEMIDYINETCLSSFTEAKGVKITKHPLQALCRMDEPERTSSNVWQMRWSCSHQKWANTC